MPSNASQSFNNLIGFVDQLVQIHGKLQTGRGRRHEQDAIHRAGVVMTIAAWESFVEKVVMEGLDALGANAGLAAAVPVAAGAAPPAWAKHAFGLRRAELANSIKRFNTPNAANVRDLFLEALEFNPWPSWTWHAGPRQWNTEEMRRRLNNWLDVRHSVAHGFELPNDVQWLQGPNGRPRLTLDLVKECKAFFGRLVAQTDAEFAQHLHRHHGIPIPW